MTSLRILAAVAAAFPLALIASPATASAGQGHYEWRPAPLVGPRGPLLAPQRVWVADEDQHLAHAGRDCPMMQKAAADCMISRKAG
jgi:hypothetical protein